LSLRRISIFRPGTTYPAGIKISDEALAELALERDAFHGEWNYRLKPRRRAG
jgi:hypothetical protein